jgi:hypothetical protein
MVAKPGDWAVTDQFGKLRSVAAAVFPATHEKIGPNRYRRVGIVRARLAVAGEIIATSEGQSVAPPESWIVEGTGGERWPVPGRQFAETYRGPIERVEGKTKTPSDLVGLTGFEPATT